MIQGIFSSLSGMLNAIRRTNITANNIANAQTPGFEAVRADNVAVDGGGVRIGAVSPEPSPSPPPFGDAFAGMPARSNVDLQTEMVNLRLNQRQFEANLNALRAQDEMLGELLDTSE